MSVYQYHQMKSLAAQVRPKVSGNRLTIEAPLDFSASGMVYVAVVGVLAAVAIPAFMKYMKKSKSSEARGMLMKLRAGVEDHLLANGSLPPPAGPTPPLGACCRAGGDEGTCAPDAAAWDNPTWRAFHFSIDDPHRYSYEFAADGDRYLLKAYGDLDCDGTYSTFTLSSDQPNVVESEPLE
jgi:type IV pilus assembly protein PilA